MQPQYSPKNNPRVIIIQKLYGKFFNKEEELTFPKHRFKKFIKDVVKGTIERNEVINNEIQILVGTQLISKGFHFPNLNCIVVVDIDLSSQGHDLRSAEKNLQLYHQLSGRAGREGQSSTVYFQTYNYNT